MTKGILYNDQGPDYTGVVFQQGQSPIYPETRTVLVDSVISRLSGDTSIAKQTLLERQTMLAERLPSLLEKARKIFTREVNGMVNPEEVEAYLVLLRDAEEETDVPALLIGRKDLGDYFIAKVEGKDFDYVEIYSAIEITARDPFYVISQKTDE